jgi:hypothetical protein
MGFDLYICDPNGDDTEAQARCLEALEDLGELPPPPPPEDVEAFGQWVSIPYEAQRSTGLYFRASVSTWGALVSEMRAQGMVGTPGIPEDKLRGNGGQHITREEAHDAFIIASETPTAPPDYEAAFEWDEMMATVTEGGEVLNPSRQALASASPEQWTTFWQSWLNFLGRAREEGGFIVR